LRVVKLQSEDLYNYYLHFNGSKDGFVEFLVRYMELAIEDK